MKKNKLFAALAGIVMIANMLACSFYSVRAENTSNANELSVSYRTHVENVGWQNYVKDGETAGTTGESLRLEGINIKLNNSDINIKYQVHIQNIGWQDWKSNDEMAGTSGQSLRLEAIKIALENTEEYDIKYRVHVQFLGWQDWKQNGELAGTTGQSLRLEAIEIKLVPKFGVKYSGHVENIGWQEKVKNGETAGTTGQSQVIVYGIGSVLSTIMAYYMISNYSLLGAGITYLFSMLFPFVIFMIIMIISMKKYKKEWCKNESINNNSNI